MYKKQLNGCHANSLLILMAFFVVLLINSSCVLYPLPAYDLRSHKGVIDKKLIKSLEPGKATREDLLLLAGEPDTQFEKDRYFIYYWEASEGMAYPNVDIIIYHFFCVEFDEDNRIKRLKHIQSGFFKNLSKAHHEMYEWMSESD